MDKIRKFKIAITSQNLNPNIVVSGISSVVKAIVQDERFNFYVYEVGYTDGKGRSKDLKWVFLQVKKVFLFPFFLRKHDVDLLHLNVPFSTLGIIREFLFFIIGRMLCIKIIVHIHGGPHLMTKSSSNIICYLIKMLLNGSTAVIVLSDAEKTSLAFRYKYLKAIVLRNAIDSKHYGRLKSEINSHSKTILYLSRIERAKGIYEIMEALKMISNREDFQFIVCGTGPDKDIFINSCSETLGDKFSYKGIVSGVGKDSVLAQSDIFLLPSYAEGIPMALLETMATGVVPVVSRDSSMLTVVDDMHNGLVVEKRDPNDLKEKIEFLLDNHLKVCEMSYSAKYKISQKYDFKEYSNRLCEIYRTVMDNNY